MSFIYKFLMLRDLCPFRILITLRINCRRLRPRSASFGQEERSFLFKNSLSSRLFTALTSQSRTSFDELVVLLCVRALKVKQKSAQIER